MTLLIVILLTAHGMLEPQVFRLATEAECIAALPKAEELAKDYGKHGYIATCVRVSGAGV